MFTPKMIGYMNKLVIPLRLACVTETGWPVAVSLWYIYLDGAIYCATQDNARTAAYLRHEPRCAFEIASDQPPYCGLRGQARAVIDPSKGAEVLEKLLVRYTSGIDSKLAKGLLAKKETEIAIRLVPVQLFTWNFKDRMKDFAKSNISKPCIE